MAVMAALLTPIFGGVYAADSPAEGTINGDCTLNVQSNNQKNEPDIDKKGNNITFASTTTAKQDMIKAKEGKTLTITGYHDLNFKDNLTDGTVNTALLASQGSNVTVQVDNNINFGSSDKEFKADQGFHAEGGKLDVTANNIYGNVRAYGFLMAQNWDGGQVGSLTVHANQDVNLTSTYAGLMTVSIFHHSSDTDESGKTKVITNSLTADNTINLRVTGKGSNTAVINLYDGNYGEIPKGDAQLTVSGKKGVSIISDYGQGILSLLTNNTDVQNPNVGTTTITSDEGDVVIQVKNEAVFSSVENNSTGKIDIAGNNIKLLSQDSKAISLSGKSQMTLAANKDQGTITISGKETAASVGTGSKLTIGDGTHDTFVNVTGQFDISGGTVTVADKTTTVVDASSLKGNSLVSVSGGTFEAEEGAKLIVKGAATGDILYTKDGDNKLTFWGAQNTSFDNPFQYLSTDGKVLAGITDANKEGIAGYAASGVAIAATEKNDENMISLIKSGKESYNGALGIGQAGGIQHSTYAVTGLFTDALADHDNTKAKDLWAKGFHSKENIDGLSFAGGGLSLDTQYNGTVVGMDVYQNEHTTAGVALTYADGNISSSNGGVYTKNDATYVGASLYGLKDLGSYRLVADLSYVGGSHDITQYNNGQVITAKPDTEAWTLGVKAMKDYTVGQGLLTPYVGLRYLRLTTDKYTSSAGLFYDKETQDLYLLPVGVDYSLQMNRGSWILKPYAGLSYIWTMGDRNANQTVTYGTATDGFAYDISDAGSFLGKLGLSASKGDYSFGVGYAYQNGSTTDSHTWTVQASYAF